MRNSKDTRTAVGADQDHLARALVAPPLRVVRHGVRLPQLPTIELAYSFGRRSNSRVVNELANYLADSLTNAGVPRVSAIL